MTEQDLQQITDLITRIVEDRISDHAHDSLGSRRLSGSRLINAPQTTLTPTTGTTAGAAYNATAQAMINNHETILAELKTKLTALGLTK